MQKPPLDPDVADTAPSDSVLTVYDEEHLITYPRLLDEECLIQNMNLIAPEGRSTAIYRAPNG
jgi:hypothetical protein